ncbi:hypothetical protein OsJ_35646 [Oryza sativa Japonica Group]|uniref:DUF4216 domain-containing protein n=1 Tax=Oryza sativa subsp. japonica TaxID=39947 RepID=B9GCH2_ORYSJ|nr:hypothetical protein OsJ_35646 [Oryza sativa Japonica Group]
MSQQHFSEHEDVLEAQGVGNIANRQQQEFATWLRQRVIDLRKDGSSQVSDCLYALAIGPYKKLHKYSGCIIGGVRFLTKEREEGRKTQNSGVCVEGPHKGKIITYYGTLTDIYVLDYPNDRQVAFFMCDWYDLERNKPVIIDNDFVSINISKRWYTDDNYVLASQVKQVFYVPDTKLKGNWQVVQKVNHRHLFDPEVWSAGSESALDIGANEDIAFQEEEGGDIVLDDTFEANTLSRDDVIPEIVSDPKEIASLKEGLVSRSECEEETEN